MYETQVTKIPASWSNESYKTANGMNGHTNGLVNGHADGSNNGYKSGHSRGHSIDSTLLPSSFLEGKTVKTVYGLVPLKHALDWPVYASYDELAGCAAWMGGRIPTFEEARSIYAYVDYMKKGEAERKLGKTVPAVNG